MLVRRMMKAARVVELIRHLALMAQLLIRRMMRAAGLDASLYEEVERNTNATYQALLVVIIVSLASGLGSMLSEATAGHGIGVNALIAGFVGALVFWAIWSFLVYWIGARYFRSKATYGALLRCIGFAYSPGALNFFRFVRVLGGLVSFIVLIWVLCTGIIAARQSLNVSDGKAIAACVIGWIVGNIARGTVMCIFGVAVF